jgi:hypothetical protein
MERNAWSISKCEFRAPRHLRKPQLLFSQIIVRSFVDSVWLIRYKNMAALEAHRQSDVYAMVQKRGAETQLLAAAPDIKILQHVGGFASR